MRAQDSQSQSTNVAIRRKIMDEAYNAFFTRPSAKNWTAMEREMRFYQEAVTELDEIMAEEARALVAA